MAFTKTARTSLYVFAGTLTSRILGFVRILILATTLGFFRLNDSYSLSNEIPNMMYELVLGSLISSTLLPFFVKQYKQKNKKDDQSIFTFMVFASLALTLLSLIFAPAIASIVTSLNSTSSANTHRELVLFFLYCFLPQIFFYALTSVMQTYLAARHKFIASSFAPVINNIIVISMLFYVKHLLSSFGDNPSDALLKKVEYTLGFGTTFGVIAISLIVGIAYVKGGGKFKRGLVRTRAIKEMLQQSKWMVSYAIVNQIALFAIISIANKTEGGVSRYLSAWAFFQLPHGLLAMTIMTIAIPKISHSMNHDIKNEEGIQPNQITIETRSLVKQSGTAIVMLISVVSALGISIARPFMTIILGHGEISISQAKLAGNVLIGFLIFSSAFSFYVFVVRLANLVGKTKGIFKINVIQNSLNIILAILLIKIWPAIGLSIAFSMSYFLIMPLALKMVSKNFLTPALNGKATSIVGITSICGGLLGFIAGHGIDNIYLSTVIGLLTCLIILGISSHFAREEIISLFRIFYKKSIPTER